MARPEYPPILEEHRSAPDWATMDFDARQDHRLKVWQYYKPGWGTEGYIDPNHIDDDPEVLEILALHIDPVLVDKMSGGYSGKTPIPYPTKP